MSAANAYPWIEENRRQLDRMRTLVERLGDADLQRQVNPEWTVAGVLGHLAFWDGRNLVLAGKLRRGEPFTESDDEPEDVTWINDAARPLIHAIPAREAARLALRIAEEIDEVVASLPPELAAKTWPADPDSRLNPLRASHRGEHLDEIEAALR